MFSKGKSHDFENDWPGMAVNTAHPGALIEVGFCTEYQIVVGVVVEVQGHIYLPTSVESVSHISQYI